MTRNPFLRAITLIRLAALLLFALSAGTPAGSTEVEKTWSFQGTRKPDEELKVTRVTRLTHPLVHANMVDFWYSAHYAYNCDGTRIMYFEVSKTKDIRQPGVVWARISDLKKWTTLKDYLESAHPIPSVDPAKETSPNTGIAGYNVFRDDVKIDVVRGRGTQHVDHFNLMRGRSYRYFISAYDRMARESPRTGEVPVAVK